MTDAPPAQKSPRQYQKHGDSYRERRLRTRGLAAIDARSVEGREALAWRDAAVKAKVGPACPYLVKVEINLACYDLWRLLSLQTYLIADANRRSTIVNKRRRELPTVHSQYDQIDARFMRRVESLELDKAPVMDLARRLAQARTDQEHQN